MSLFYTYDDAGRLSNIRYIIDSIGYQHNYYPVCNSRGDVEAIYDYSGNFMAKYTYDAWGLILSITDANGNVITDMNHIGHLNPFRYRGYYYDTETGSYYLQSRYYDPGVRRFFNADNQLNSGLQGNNMFTYCGNNPVNGIDPDGHAWYHWAAAAAVGAVCAIAVVATAGTASIAIAAVVSAATGTCAFSGGVAIAATAFAGAATTLGTIAAVAALNSNTVKDFNSKGNWGTVAATAGSAVLGGVSAYIADKTTNTSRLEKYVDNPQKLKNVNPIKLEKIAIKEDLQVSTLSRGSHAGQGLKVTWGGDRLLQYHPGGGHHGPASYWKVSSGENGIIRIFNDN